MQTTIDSARKFEAKHRTPQALRPVFHVTPPVGWCNDPNGWSYYRGQAHLFFQYHPYGTNWGPMHWGHTVTADFLHWEDLPCALAPDSDYDAAGCFSGGAIEWQGKQLILYTGVQPSREKRLRKEALAMDDGLTCICAQSDGEKLMQQQCLAIGDGVNYEKAAENPVIPASQQPEGYSTCDFRDPYLFTRDNSLYAVVSGRGAQGRSRILLYAAETPTQWRFVQVIAENTENLGSMWECPSLFRLGEKDILLVSPQFMRETADGRYHHGNDVVALIGRWDGIGKPFARESDTPLDSGLDFYAPQVLQTTDGRTVLIGWMQNWDHCLPPEGAYWYGQMTLPRELFWQGDALCQRPVRELDAARKLRVRHTNVAVDTKAQKLQDVRGRVLDCTLHVHCEKATRFGIRFACGDGLYAELRLDLDDGLLRTDRRHAGGVRDGIDLRETPLVAIDGEFTLRMVLDRYSAEFFLQDGRQVAGMTLYDAPLDADGIEFFARGACRMDLELYDLEL